MTMPRRTFEHPAIQREAVKLAAIMLQSRSMDGLSYEARCNNALVCFIAYAAGETILLPFTEEACYGALCHVGGVLADDYLSKRSNPKED